MSRADPRSLAEVPDDELMARLRRGEAAACHEFFARFAPMLLELAARQGVPREWCWEPVTDLLDDVAERIRAHRLPAVASLAAYLASALRRRLSNARRDRRRRERLAREVAVEAGAPGESAVLSTCSAHSLRASRPPDDGDPDGLHPIVRGFHDHVRATLSEDEWRILGWIGERVPQREIAEWMGTTHGAMRVRVARLRARAAAAGRRYLDALAPPERALLDRFLGGNGTTTGAAGHTEERSDES